MTTEPTVVEVYTRAQRQWNLRARHNFPAGPETPTELGELAIRATYGQLPETKYVESVAVAARAVVKDDTGRELTVVEIGAGLTDADTDEQIRRATWGEMAQSINAPDGVFDLDGRRVYVA